MPSSQNSVYQGLKVSMLGAHLGMTKTALPAWIWGHRETLNMDAGTMNVEVSVYFRGISLEVEGSLSHTVGVRPEP